MKPLHMTGWWTGIEGRAALAEEISKMRVLASELQRSIPERREHVRLLGLLKKVRNEKRFSSSHPLVGGRFGEAKTEVRPHRAGREEDRG
jgi:hypothetical protein